MSESGSKTDFSSRHFSFQKHCRLAGEYRRAIYRPWTFIDERKYTHPGD